MTEWEWWAPCHQLSVDRSPHLYAKFISWLHFRVDGSWTVKLAMAALMAAADAGCERRRCQWCAQFHVHKLPYGRAIGNGSDGTTGSERAIHQPTPHQIFTAIFHRLTSSSSDWSSPTDRTALREWSLAVPCIRYDTEVYSADWTPVWARVTNQSEYMANVLRFTHSSSFPFARQIIKPAHR